MADAAAVPLWFVAREARKHVKVVLSGEGADELFGGYGVYYQPGVVRAATGRCRTGAGPRSAGIAAEMPAGGGARACSAGPRRRCAALHRQRVRVPRRRGGLLARAAPAASST